MSSTTFLDRQRRLRHNDDARRRVPVPRPRAAPTTQTKDECAVSDPASERTHAAPLRPPGRLRPRDDRRHPGRRLRLPRRAAAPTGGSRWSSRSPTAVTATSSTCTARRPAASSAAPGPTEVEICMTVTFVDGLVVARSTYNTDINYRSVVIIGTRHRGEGPRREAPGPGPHGGPHHPGPQPRCPAPDREGAAQHHAAAPAPGRVLGQGAHRLAARRGGGLRPRRSGPASSPSPPSIEPALVDPALRVDRRRCRAYVGALPPRRSARRSTRRTVAV